MLLDPRKENELRGEGQAGGADKGHTSYSDPAQPELKGDGPRAAAGDGPPANAEALQPTIALIRHWHRHRVFAMEQRKRQDLALGSFLRPPLGWSKSLPEAERKRIATQAAALIDLGEQERKAAAKGEALKIDEPAYAEWRTIIAASIAGREPFDIVEKTATKEMERLARTLPVWSWAEGVRGFSARSLAVIVGEAGDLGAYPKKGHLWKRMGLAVMGAGDGVADVRQGGLGKGAGKDEWIAHGYSAKRRSAMFVIGDVLVKVGDEYRAVYLRRKEFERARAEAAGLTVVPAAKIPKWERAAGYVSDGHIHRRAQRYMEKRLLRDLWQAWRNQGKANQSLPLAA